MASGVPKTAYVAATDEMDIAEITIGDLLRQQARHHSHSEALIEILGNGSVGRRWNYLALLGASERLARALASRFAKGERIVVWATNCPEWVLLEYATALAGLVLVTANPKLKAAELRYVVEQSGAVALFHGEDDDGRPMTPDAIAAVEGNGAIRERVLLTDEAALGTDDADLPEVLPDDPAQIQYTSGTTGFPKGATLSHRGLVNNARFTGTRAGMGPDSTLVTVLPLFHTGGCGVNVLGALQGGSRIVLVPRFDPALIGRVIARERATILVAVPTMLLALLEAVRREPFDTSSLCHVVSGGAMVAPALVRAVREEFGASFAVVYGQTEYCPITNMHRLDDDPEVVARTVGPAVPQTEISIRRPEDNAVCDIGEVGEICARGPCTMIGYHGNPEATQAAIDSEHWLHTGDLGWMDENGHVVVNGRLKDMIIRGGENLYPVEIENVLIEHPSIAEVAVVGLPDDYWGEIVAAYVRLAPGHRLCPDELKRFAREKMSPQKTPARWVAVEAFPLTASGKIQKFKLREMAR